MSLFSSISPVFRKFSLTETMARQLEEAERGLLEAQDAVEYSQAIAAYHRGRIARLRGLLKDAEPAPTVINDAVIQEPNDYFGKAMTRAAVRPVPDATPYPKAGGMA